MKKTRNILISIISIILALSVTISVGFGCNEEKAVEGKEEISFEGTHLFNTEFTSKPLIQNGKTNYKLVVPAHPTERETVAKQEFTRLWKAATGNDIGALVDTGLTHEAGQQYISLGNTELIQTSGFVTLGEGESVYDVLYDTLEYDGVKIKTIDDNIYLIGGSDFGTVYAGYDFMQILFNYDFYYWDCFDIDKNVKNVNLPIFDVVDIPDIPFRGYSVGYQRQYKSVTESDPDIQFCGWRMRQPYGYWHTQQGTPKYIKVGDEWKLSTSTAGVHNDMDVIDPQVYKADHPSWFSNGGDISFTCGNAIPEGNETKEEAIAREHEALCQELAKRMFQTALYQQAEFKGTPLRRYLLMTMEDATSPDTSDASRNNTEKYGAYSSNIIIAMNRVRDILYNDYFAVEKEKCEADPNYEGVYFELLNKNLRYEDYYREDFSLQFFAYAYGGDAPAVQDDNGNWVATYPEMYLKPNITPWVAISASVKNAYYSDANNQWKARLNGWNAVSTDGYIHWGYATSFANNALPYDTFQVYTPEHYKLLAKTNCKQTFEETNMGTDRAITSFTQLFAYLDTKLTWNCNLDFNTLVTKFFKAMYQDAWEVMYQMYTSEKEYASYIWNHDSSFSTGANSVKASFWSSSVAKDWISYVDLALAKIDYLKTTDYNLYVSTRNHINSEWAAPAFILLQFYSAKLNQEESDSLKEKFKNVIVECKLNSLGQGNSTYQSFLNSLA